MDKDVVVECPCCASKLEVDVRTGKILRWRGKDEEEEAGKAPSSEGHWNSAAERVSRRLGDATDKFDQSLSREKDRARDLEELFRKASDKLHRQGEE